MPTSSSRNAFAEDPGAHLPQAAGTRIVDDRRFHLSIDSDETRATVCRIRLGDDAVDEVFAEVAGHAPGARVEWVIGPSATPEDLVSQLRALGCRDQDPPLSSTVTALATDTAPPPVPGVAVHRIETYDGFLAGLELSIAGWQLDAVRAEAYRNASVATWERRRSRPGGEWLAVIDGEPVAYGGAIAGPHGSLLTGGVTLPDAVGRGAAALVVHAEEPSRRVLEGLGFETVCPIVELVSGPA